MNIYRLDPIDAKHPSWAMSAEKETLWAAAATPDEARSLVAAKTRTGSAGGSPDTRKSPWQDAAVTSCVWDPTLSHVRDGTVERADGSRVDD